ncbi:ABC transporter ATP-binding protein [uncultured Helcococcus sp.]|uniref:ABC transporter ATP-binding protein n=1 Tax=uncultured Helcococcus sp. TaxID=1072508 RepID=UPI00263693B4|nr:ABC transporter ATP-binding protein [uncultured Helcococcus sp.]
MAILKVTNLTKNYGKHEVLKGINLLLEEPGIYALIGPNGSGKTTLFNTISNLLKPTSGEIEVLGKKNTDASIFYEVSFLKDNRVLYEYLSGYDHLTFIQSAQKLPKERVDEVIKKMQIGHYVHKKVGDYSLGMKQSLLIAMAMLNKPKLMILDEPLNGLDPTSVIKVRYLLKELTENGTTILISSHTLSEIDLITDNIMFLKDGRIVEEKIEIANDNIYAINVETTDNLEKILEGFEYKIEDNLLKVNLHEKDIFELLTKLHENQIKYLDISKVKRGTEDRYMEMFPEEIAKIRQQ